jgi:hypothetical protein
MAISLASISKTQRNSLPPRVVVHGEEGVGKSTLGATAYNPIFMPFEDGLAGIETNSFPLLTTLADTKAAIAVLLNEKHEFGTVVVDSLDWLQDKVVWPEIAKRHGKNHVQDIPYGAGYNEAAQVFAELLSSLDELRHKRGMAILLLAHSQVKRYEAPDSEPFDKIEIKLHKKTTELVKEWSDILGHAYHETAIKKETNGFNTRARGIATGRRMLRVAGSASASAKNRYGLPDTIDLSWDALMSAMNPASDTAAAA